MRLLLDTTALSELSKPRGDEAFASWFETVETDLIYHSVLTIAEVRKGSLGLPHGPRRREIERFISDLLNEQGVRVLDVDLAVADAWASVAFGHRAARLTVNAVDELIAATAIVHDLTVVTRNVKHFERSSCRLLSPWSA